MANSSESMFKKALKIVFKIIEIGIDVQNEKRQIINKQRAQTSDYVSLDNESVDDQKVKGEIEELTVPTGATGATGSTGATLLFPFTFQHLKTYLTLEGNDKVSNWKFWIAMSFTIFLLVSYYIDFYVLKDNISYVEQTSNFKHNKVTYWVFLYIVIGYVLNLLLSNKIRSCVYSTLNLGKDCVNPFSLINRNNHSNRKVYILHLISPDLYFSKCYKQKIESNDNISNEENFTYQDFNEKSPKAINEIRIYNKALIQRTNWRNVISSFLLTIIIYCLLLFINLLWLSQLILAFLILRLISRGVEVLVAFYNDVVRTNEKVFFKIEKEDDSKIVETKFIQDYKNSILLPKARISLAVHSLVEFNVLFAVTYYVFYKVMNSISNVYFDPYSWSYTEMPYLETLLYSSTLSVFNISYIASSNILMNGLHFLQIMISCVLILIAIAQYMGLSKPFNNEERLFYKHIQLFNLKQENLEKFKSISGNEEFAKEVGDTDEKDIEKYVQALYGDERESIKDKELF